MAYATSHAGPPFITARGADGLFSFLDGRCRIERAAAISMGAKAYMTAHFASINISAPTPMGASALPLARRRAAARHGTLGQLVLLRPASPRCRASPRIFDAAQMLHARAMPHVMMLRRNITTAA